MRILQIKTKNATYKNFFYAGLTKPDISILLGNALDRFDTSLYNFLAPIMGPLFFPQYDGVVQLICVYGIAATSTIARPLGTVLFCALARWHGPTYALSYSLCGVGLATVFIGCLPCYDAIGGYAPVALIILRLLKGICAAGESVIAKVYIMENKSDQSALRASYWYQSSSMLGIVLASAVALYAIDGDHAYWWRLCFWVGGCTGLLGYFMRSGTTQCEREMVVSIKKESRQFALGSMWTHKKNIARIALVTCFSHATYAVPFVLMNVLVPRISAHSLETMMLLNTTLLVFDMVMIPVLGYMLERFDHKATMIFASGILSLTLIPLFFFLPQASLAYVTAVRLWIVFWGLIFLCPLNFWCKTIGASDQYLLMGVGNAVGTATLAHMTTPICLWLWYVTGVVWMPAAYVALLMFLTAYVVFESR